LEASISIPSIVAVSESSSFSSSIFGDREGEGTWNAEIVGEGIKNADFDGEGRMKAVSVVKFVADVAGDVTFVTLLGFLLI
jgi:hypothetical protein